MTALVVVTVTALCRKVEGVAQNPVEILVHQLAAVYGHYGHKVSYLMHAKAKGTVLDQISEGVFHLVSVSVTEALGAPFDTVEKAGADLLIPEMRQYLGFLYLKLLVIAYALIEASAAELVVSADAHILKIRISHKNPP